MAKQCTAYMSLISQLQRLTKVSEQIGMDEPTETDMLDVDPMEIDGPIEAVITIPGPMETDEPTEVSTGCEMNPENNSFNGDPMELYEDAEGLLLPEPSGPRDLSKFSANRVRPDHSRTGRNILTSDKSARPFNTVGIAVRKRSSRAHHSKKQIRISMQDYDKHRMGKLVLMESLSYRLVRRDAMETFADSCKMIWEDWISLLRKTTLPPDIASSDIRVTAAFRAVDSVIFERQSKYVLRWLAYVQLMRIFDSLKPIIRLEREKGVAHRERGDRDVSAAIDVYQNTQQTRSDARDPRHVIKEHRRTGRRVRSLTGPSPLFLLIYSEEAEAVVRDFKRIDDKTLATVVRKIVQRYPNRFIRSCTRLAERAESAVRSNSSFDSLEIRDIAWYKDKRLLRIY